MVLMTEYWKNPHFGCLWCGENGDASFRNLLTCCCPPLCYGRAVAKSYHPQFKTNLCDCCFFACTVCYPGTYTLFRMGHHIKGSACLDTLYFCFCWPYLALPCIQVANESDSRMTRPYSFPQRNPVQKEWDSEMFSTEDPAGIVYGCCCPCCAFGEVGYSYARMGWLYGVFCMHPAVLRYDMRHEYNIEGACYKDLFYTRCCSGFAYVQMKKEVEVKGPAFGIFDYGDSSFLSMSNEQRSSLVKDSVSLKFPYEAYHKPNHQEEQGVLYPNEFGPTPYDMGEEGGNLAVAPWW